MRFVGNVRKVRSKYKTMEIINWMRWGAWWYVGECEISCPYVIGDRRVRNGISRLDFRDLYHSLWGKLPFKMTLNIFVSKYSFSIKHKEKKKEYWQSVYQGNWGSWNVRPGKKLKIPLSTCQLSSCLIQEEMHQWGFRMRQMSNSNKGNNPAWHKVFASWTRTGLVRYSCVFL